MQELIDNLKSIDINVPNGFKLIFIEKEKQQMINFAYGFYDKCFTKYGIIQKSAGEYYNQTYNQNEI